MTRSYLAVADSPLVFRTGRPFGAADASGGGDSYDFPMPATTAGALRAAWCDAAGRDPGQAHDPLRNAIQVRGPLHCTVTAAAAVQLWLPAPADAAYTVPAVAGRRARCLPLMPVEAPAGAGCDLPFKLQPRSFPRGVQTRAAADGWSLAALDAWLHRPDGAPRGLPQVMPPPRRDRRVHVAMDPSLQRAQAGALYFSEGLDFTLPAEKANWTQGLMLYVDAPEGAQVGLDALNHHHGRLGADGRTAAYCELPAHVPPACSDTLGAGLDAIAPGDTVRLYLATPACYLRNGWYPDGLKPDAESGMLRGSPPGLRGWTFELTSAAVGRFGTHSGAAMRNAQGQPVHLRKPLRRLAPAGSVYWLRVLEKATNAVPLRQRWLQPTCYAEYARDGHGLGLWGLA